MCLASRSAQRERERITHLLIYVPTAAAGALPDWSWEPGLLVHGRNPTTWVNLRWLPDNNRKWDQEQSWDSILGTLIWIVSELNLPYYNAHVPSPSLLFRVWWWKGWQKQFRLVVVGSITVRSSRGNMEECQWLCSRKAYLRLSLFLSEKFKWQRCLWKFAKELAKNRSYPSYLTCCFF